mgnify:CR=1 FL=1
MENRDNQQATSETDKAWLAGAIEGDGSISMGFQKSPRANNKEGFAAVPSISFCNQDSLLIERVVYLLKEMGQKNVYIREVKGNYENSRDTMSVRLTGLRSVLNVLQAILPYLIGDKTAKTRLLISYLNSRLSRTRTEQGNPPYNEMELLLIERFYENTARKGGRRNPDIGRVLRDYKHTVLQTKI